MASQSVAKGRTPIPGILTALIAWTGLCFGLVGVLEVNSTGSAFGMTWIQWGFAACGVGVLASVALLPLGYFRLGKSAIVTLGVSPFLIFGLFIYWRMNVSDAQRVRCFESDDAEACRVLAEVRAKRGHSEDAVGLMLKGCSLEDARSCRALGGQLNRYPDLHEEPALVYFSKACDLGDGLGCDRAGQLTRTSDPEAARVFFARGCEAGFLSSCH